MAEAAPAKPGKPWWLLLLVALAVGILVYAAIPPAAPELSALVGAWQREDGGYALEVKSVAPDGAAEAAYRNPERPIRVERASASRQEEGLVLTVILRDEGYPGSTYTLLYDPKADRLAGGYFLAAQGQTHPVSFVREKKP